MCNDDIISKHHFRKKRTYRYPNWYNKPEIIKYRQLKYTILVWFTGRLSMFTKGRVGALIHSQGGNESLWLAMSMEPTDEKLCMLSGHIQACSVITIKTNNPVSQT